MKKIGVIYGGMSTENEVSKKSAKSILENLDEKKYKVFPIYIDIKGIWYYNDEEIENVFKFLKNLDIVFPVLHGLYGEDGTIQGLLELLKIPYVGCGVLASSVGMDKGIAKIIFEKAKINQAKYIYVKKGKNRKYIYVDKELNETEVDMKQLINTIEHKIKYPIFVKPSNSGSSVGVNKAENKKDLEKNIKEAFKYDSKILIEKAIDGKEVECAVLGNSKTGVIASRVGEILSAEDFYTFDAKYNNENSKTLIPARISSSQEKEIQELAIKAFNAIDGNGLSRVDFFVQAGTKKIFINEINTMPGFTNISMYPMLMKNYGFSYSELLNKLIEYAKK